MRHGTTLLELLLALVVAGILAALAVPAAGAVRDRLQVDAAARALASAHARARLLAVVEQRVMVLTLTADSLVLRAVESPADTVARWRAPGPAGEQVTAQGLPRQVAFAPSGAAIGAANGSYTLSRGAARRQVVVSRYGRVRIL
jgi:prepilin-type N-terminal cleavage/methylation domain-containing protein